MIADRPTFEYLSVFMAAFMQTVLSVDRPTFEYLSVFTAAFMHTILIVYRTTFDILQYLLLRSCIHFCLLIGLLQIFSAHLTLLLLIFMFVNKLIIICFVIMVVGGRGRVVVCVSESVVVLRQEISVFPSSSYKYSCSK